MSDLKPQVKGQTMKKPLGVCDQKFNGNLRHVKQPSCINWRPVEASAPAAPPHEYKHYLWCNGDRRFPAGEPGHCCSCFNDINTRAALLSAAPPDAAPKDQTQAAIEEALLVAIDEAIISHAVDYKAHIVFPTELRDTILAAILPILRSGK